MIQLIIYKDSVSIHQEEQLIIYKNNRDDSKNIFQVTFFVWFVLTKTRHLAAENGSCSVLSSGGVSSTFILFDEINLDPTFLLFWIRILVEMTP
jgi:hypothetical protein